MMNGKNILLGVTGGIACYKAADLARKLVKQGANVDVVMTKSATEFVSPLTFQTLTANPVHLDLFNLIEESQIGHISLARRADLIVVAPATANILAKVAHGIADDLLSTVICATKARVLFCPAMNDQMWANPITQENVKILQRHGYHFAEPEEGELACRTEGKGRLADPSVILDVIEDLLTEKTLKGKRILVTAGPTQEPIDAVRYLSNRSSGKMGFALAKEARNAGADVTLISGPTSIDPPLRVAIVKVKTALEMQKALKAQINKHDALIMCAAVADFRPAEKKNVKTPKEMMPKAVELIRNPDLVAEIAANKSSRIIVGFAAQTDENPLLKAEEKLRKKKLDFIVVNDVSDSAIGFESEENEVVIIAKDGRKQHVPRASKNDVAREVLNFVFDQS